MKWENLIKRVCRFLLVVVYFLGLVARLPPGGRGEGRDYTRSRPHRGGLVGGRVTQRTRWGVGVALPLPAVKRGRSVRPPPAPGEPARPRCPRGPGPFPPVPGPPACTAPCPHLPSRRPCSARPRAYPAPRVGDSGGVKQARTAIPPSRGVPAGLSRFPPSHAAHPALCPPLGAGVPGCGQEKPPTCSDNVPSAGWCAVGPWAELLCGVTAVRGPG